jgi:hypothetical protein
MMRAALAAVLGGVIAMVPVITSVDAGAPSSPDIASTVTLDHRSGTTLLPDVATMVQRQCATSDYVTVAVKGDTSTFRTRFDCIEEGSGPPVTITDQLVATASKHNGAASKADRVLALQEALPSTPGLTFDRDAMIWSFAAGRPMTCQRAERPQEIRSEMAIGAEVNGETPEHWTLIEAVMIAGACPRQLPLLFGNVRKIGEPEAAATVARLLQQASVGSKQLPGAPTAPVGADFDR